MKKLIVLLLCGCLAAASTSSAIDLKQSKLTQVVNDVQIISAASQSKKTAAVNDLFNMPDILRTGAGSRAELVAADETVTRVGANTIFSFDPANRTIDLKQGSLLFHSPHGKGGGTIHTGSATASVLGTTLIVTTTPNGGMKVLDLEGTVQVNFTNHLKQKLEAGQMTFILPGANQLAPIIIFRLDELTKNSLLVKSFAQPLASQPLIEKQVTKQTSLINSGGASDTGKIVGDTAGPDKVEVLDVNTVQTSVGSSAVRTALNADATINQSSLTDVSIPTPPKHVFADQLFGLPNVAGFGSRQFTGFAAHNIFFNTIGADGLTVDISPYASKSEFDIVAANNMTFGGSVTFSGFSSQNSIFFSLIAGNDLSLSPGTTITGDVGNFELSAGHKFMMDNSSLQNHMGNLRITSGTDISVANSAVSAYGNVSIVGGGNFSLDHTVINCDTVLMTPIGGSLTLDYGTFNIGHFGVVAANGDVNITHSSFNTSPDYGVVNISSKSGSANVSSTAITTHFLTLNSGDGILLDGNGGSFTATGNGATANLMAVNTADIKNNNFTGFSVLNITAHTVVLANNAFDNTVNLKSDNGVWHNGYLLGDVCDLGGNTWHGSAVSAADGFSGTLAGTGITVGKR